MATAHHNIAEHIDEPAVNVIREPRVAGPGDNTLDNLIVKTEIQDGIHHTWHRYRGAASHTNQQGLLGIAEFRVHSFFELCDVFVDLFGQACRPFSIIVPIFIAYLCGNGKTRWYGNAKACHFGKIRPFASEQFLHASITFGFSTSEEINSFLCHYQNLLFKQLIVPRNPAPDSDYVAYNSTISCFASINKTSSILYSAPVSMIKTG